MQKISMAFSEVYEILRFLDKDLLERIPASVLKFIEEESDKNYKVDLNPELSLEEQNISTEAYNALGILKLKYWCKDDNEKQELMSIINKNEIIYENLEIEKYNLENIFNKKQRKNLESDNKCTQMINNKESFFKKIWKKIRSFFYKG